MAQSLANIQLHLIFSTKNRTRLVRVGLDRSVSGVVFPRFRKRNRRYT